MQSGSVNPGRSAPRRTSRRRAVTLGVFSVGVEKGELMSVVSWNGQASHASPGVPMRKRFVGMDEADVEATENA